MTSLMDRVPEGSSPRPLLFLIYINDLDSATEFSYIHHFADDTNILYRHQSLRKINQRINFDLKNIVEWLRANRIALNIKTKTVIFRSPQKTMTKKMNFRISRQRIQPKSSAKYLSLVIDEFLNWKTHFTILRATAQLHSSKPELQFCTGSNPACSMSEFAMVRISDNGPGWK